MPRAMRQDLCGFIVFLCALTLVLSLGYIGYKGGFDADSAKEVVLSFKKTAVMMAAAVATAGTTTVYYFYGDCFETKAGTSKFMKFLLFATGWLFFFGLVALVIAGSMGMLDDSHDPTLLYLILGAYMAGRIGTMICGFYFLVTGKINPDNIGSDSASRELVDPVPCPVSQPASHHRSGQERHRRSVEGSPSNVPVRHQSRSHHRGHARNDANAWGESAPGEPERTDSEVLDLLDEMNIHSSEPAGSVPYHPVSHPRGRSGTRWKRRRLKEELPFGNLDQVLSLLMNLLVIGCIVYLLLFRKRSSKSAIPVWSMEHESS